MMVSIHMSERRECFQDNRPTLPNMDDETIDPDLRELGASLLNNVLS